MRSYQKAEFIPDPEQQVLKPDISGNKINGLHEQKRRRPSLIYWHHPNKIAHGKLQNWMLERTKTLVPETADMENGLGGRGSRERAPIATQQQNQTAGEWSRQIKTFALEHEADLVGIAKLDPLWIFEDYEMDLPWVIVLGVAMDHEKLATAPEPPSVVEVMTQYNRGTRASRALADWIHGQGYQAEAHGGPTAGPITLIPAAIECGFGELGKHGSIINRQYGSSFRLAAVLTDVPLLADQADIFGADDFCLRCQACVRHCPPNAISNHKQMVRGVQKWYVDFDKCLPYFNENSRLWYLHRNLSLESSR